MTAAEEIAAVAGKISLSQIPATTVERAKLFLIDTIGVALTGKTAEGAQSVIDMILELGGKREATILGVGKKAPAPMAALANSMMAHSRDFDDLHEPGGAHVNVSVIPSALATAQRKGGVSGKKLLNGVIMGVDLVCRLSAHIPIFRGWHVTSTYGIFGSALAAGMILGLTPEHIANALGIAYSQAAGTRQARLEGSLTKRIQPALACQAGVLAALLAERGITGPKEWIEGMWGLARVYGNTHESLPEDTGRLLTSGLGEIFLGDELSFKMYPCCKVAHTSIEAALDLVHEHRIHADEVNHIHVRISQGAYNTVGRPFEIRKNPQVDAQFSAPYAVALAVIQKNVDLAGFEEEVIRDPEINALAKKVHVKIDPEMKDVSANVVNLAAKVAIHTERGAFFKELAICKGHPENPASKDEVFKKFLNCARYGKTLSEIEAEKTLECLVHLEDVGDIGTIFDTIPWKA